MPGAHQIGMPADGADDRAYCTGVGQEMLAEALARRPVSVFQHCFLGAGVFSSVCKPTCELFHYRLEISGQLRIYSPLQSPEHAFELRDSGV